MRNTSQCTGCSFGSEWICRKGEMLVGTVTALQVKSGWSAYRAKNSD